MHKLYILLLSTLLTSTTTFASIAIDSVGVENNKGKKVILYKVEAKETYYSIAKKYNVPYKEVMEFNDSQLLQIGLTLKVPTSLPFFSESSVSNPVASSPPASGWVEYTIKAKDNLNMLANKYGTTVEEIKKLNQLTSIGLQIGQVLKIPTQQERTVATTTEVIPTPVYKSPTKTVVKTVDAPLSTTSAIGTVISHSVKAKENLNALAEKYGTTVEDIKKLNNLNSSNLRIGQVLKISSVRGESDQSQEVMSADVNTKPLISTPTPSDVSRSDGSFEHIVAVGETIYSVAKKYSLTTYQLKTTNNLTGNDLVTGQKLIIKGANKPVVTNTESEETATTVTTGETMKDLTLRQPASKYGLVSFNEKGVAVWIVADDLDPTKMLVLHRTAPVGTIIRVTNPMTNRSAFAKVVGKFTENETTKDVIIVMTKAVADAVGALDKRFSCNLNYGTVENEQ